MRYLEKKPSSVKNLFPSPVHTIYADQTGGTIMQSSDVTTWVSNRKTEVVNRHLALNVLDAALPSGE